MRQARRRSFARTRLAAMLLLAGATPAGAATIRYIPRHDELVYTFAAHPPKRTLSPGDTLVTWTEDCYDGRVSRPQDVPSKLVPPGRENPQTGPFFIEGAQPGDTLVVEILSVEPARDYAVSSAFPHFGALTATGSTALLHEPLPEVVWIYPVERADRAVRFVPVRPGSRAAPPVPSIPIAPFLGCLATAPAHGEARSTVVPDSFGGNMDTPEVRAGSRVYLPVNVPGALLMLGDGHLVQGGGEIIGTGVESAMDVSVRVDLIKGRAIAWPRIEDAEHLMVVGSARPLEDALRIAFKELVLWVAERGGLDPMDAYQLVSQVAQAPVSQAVDPLYTVVAKFPKRFLPQAP